MPYKVWADTDALNAADLNAMTADAVSNYVGTSETTTSTTYTDLATAGPAATITLVNGQQCMVIVSARTTNSSGGSGFAAYMSYAVSGASTVAANDNDAVISLLTTAVGITGTRTTFYTATATGSHTFTAKYKVSAATGQWNERRIIAKKF